MSIHSRIALVEDDHDLLLSTQEFLSAAGYVVWGVGTAEAFYRRFVVDPVDIVVLDIGLPGEDGLSVAKLLQANPAIAVIILSARDSVDDRLAGLKAGADRYLVKPVNLMELAANIDAVAKRLELSNGKPPIQEPPLSVRSSIAPLAAKEGLSVHSLEIPGHWRLSLQDWSITSPEGEVMRLTAREFTFLQQLVSVQGQAVPKRVLTEAIFGARILNGTERLNVLIARLRKKGLESLEQELPIKTVHQLGYAFTAPAYLTQ